MNNINKVTSPQAKYLGFIATITQNFSLEDHITKITNKANLIREFCSINCTTTVKSPAYTT